jgi:hypothetical protein
VNGDENVKEMKMRTRKTPRRSAWKLAAILIAAATFAAACAPGLSPEQVQSMVGTSVAETVEAQSEMATAVAMTIEAMAPPDTATPSPTLPALDLPTLTPILPVLPTVTPFVVSSGGGGGGSVSKPKYACDVWNAKPRDNEAFKPGDPFDIKWVITNVGTEDMRAGLDLEYYSGPHLTNKSGVELPLLEPGDSYTFTADANAPLEKGNYVMTWRVEGGLCWPYVAITSGK